MNTTRSATWRAKPISWVTTSIVMPSWASPTMVSSTSLTISGSSAEVGSSNSMIFGFMHSARAIATRCCWPPESWPGYLPACSGSSPAVEELPWRFPRPRRFGNLRTKIGASVQFSSTVRCGNRLNCWNTMPTSRRIASIALDVVGQLDPVDDDLAALEVLERVDAADQRRLARARGAADDDALAARDLEVDVRAAPGTRRTICGGR